MVSKASVAPAKSGSASSTMQPRSLKAFLCFSRTAVTRGSIGRPPRLRLHATRTFPKFLFRGFENIEPGSAIDVGALGSGPAIADRRKAASETVRAIGPSTPSVFQVAFDGQCGTRPGEGRKPTTLQKLPGLRNEAARSPPSAKGSIPEATAAAAPPDEPPALLLRS